MLKKLFGSAKKAPSTVGQNTAADAQSAIPKSGAADTNEKHRDGHKRGRERGANKAAAKAVSTWSLKDFDVAILISTNG